MRALIPVWLGATPASFYQAFVRGISDALRELGHELTYLPFDNLGRASPDDAQILLRAIRREPPDVVLDIACWAYALSHSTKPSVFSTNGIAYAGMLFDHPFNQALDAIVASRLFAVYPDLGHPQQIELAHPGVKLAGGIFAPPAVQSTDKSGSSAEGRDIDVLYVGNLEIPIATRFWQDRRFLQGMDAAFDPAFCDALADAALAQPDRALHLLVKDAWNARTWREPFDFRPHMRCVEAHLRQVLRRDVVLTLARAGLRLRVVGRGWERLTWPATVTLQEPVPYEEMLRLAGAARTCLDVSTYRDGVNDRVFSYAVNGALCFTNASGYLRAALGEHGGVRFYSLANLGGLAEEICHWLAHPAALEEAGNRARASVLAAHTWRHRVEQLLPALAA